MDTPGLLVKQVKYLTWQVMDTPGLLPRGDAARNEMELLTLASMQVHACFTSTIVLVLLLPRGDAARNEMELLTLVSLQAGCSIKALFRLYSGFGKALLRLY